ncbi:MAG: alanine racemase [Pseudomonadota bacterium]
MTFHNPTLEIDLSALCANYRRLAGAAPAATAAAVVKCDAYGLGAEAVGRVLHQKENCRSFFVAYSEEGAALRKALGRDAEIFVFNGPFPDFIGTFRDYALTPVLNSLDQAALWAAQMRGAPAALNIDTGMHRLGVSPAVLSALKSMEGLNLTLVMSHLACASEAAHPMNERQRAAFAQIAGQYPSARKSLASSGGALIGENFAFDMVRVGVGLYGVSPLDDRSVPFEPVATLSAPVLQVHTMKAGETVGYGASFTAARNSTLATVALGYGDGYPRAGSNRGSAFLGGALCPIAGRVSMDLIVLDATDAPERPKIGDRAEFFGRAFSIDAAAEACGTIGYELLTGVGGLARQRGGLGGRVARRYLFDGAPAAQSLAGAEGM